jgi:uncharacterized protein with ParB-like and HNH nuclease domain
MTLSRSSFFGGKRMQIFPKPHKVADLFDIGSKRELKIPDYQRPYSWENTMIEDLFTDIRQEDRPYYAGNIIEIEADPQSSNGAETINVVDGQQRLTTLAMLLLAVYHRATSFSKDKLTEDEADLKGTLKSDIKRRLLVGKEPRLTLLEDDQKLWQALINKYTWIIHLGIWDMKSHLAGLKATFGALRILTERRSW